MSTGAKETADLARKTPVQLVMLVVKLMKKFARNLLPYMRGNFT